MYSIEFFIINISIEYYTYKNVYGKDMNTNNSIHIFLLNYTLFIYL